MERRAGVDIGHEVDLLAGGRVLNFGEGATERRPHVDRLRLDPHAP